MKAEIYLGMVHCHRHCCPLTLSNQIWRHITRFSCISLGQETELSTSENGESFERLSLAGAFVKNSSA